MNEASVTTKFKHWVANNQPESTVCWELKLVNESKNKSFAFSRVAEHQIVGLQTSLEGLWMKISDTAAVNGFSSKKPFDVVFIKATQAFVVPVFYLPRKYKKAVMIPVDDFIRLSLEWPRKSIHLDELLEKGFRVAEL